MVSVSEIVLLDGQHRYFRAAVLKARGYRVFTTQHVVEVCLRWVPGGCCALVIGPQVPWDHVATLCEWIKLNSPQKPIIVLSDRRNSRWPTPVDAVVATQPVQALVESLRVLLPMAAGQNGRVEMPAARNSALPRVPHRMRNS